MNRRDAVKRMSALAGGTLSTPIIAAILNGCAPAEKPDWLPELLSPEQDKLVIEVSELIIPKTDTPGAKDVNVNRFIDLVLKDCYTSEESANFIAGLDALNKKANDTYGNNFVECSKEEQVALLKQADEEAYADSSGNRPFFREMKQLAVVGYFTSEAGATQALNYVPVPGGYQGCIPYVEGEKAWAT
jgi:hypothetical protein